MGVLSRLDMSPETDKPSLPHPALLRTRKDVPEQGSWFPPLSTKPKP